MYKFAILDPRSVSAATEANEKVFATSVYGIEVTVPALAGRCVSNLDPQHSGGDATKAAIEDALTSELPPSGSTLATIRADLDSVGAMAILSLRAKGANLTPMLEALDRKPRLDLVAEADRFARGGYNGPKPLPTRDNPWSEGGTAESSQPLAAIAAAVADFKVPLDQRVAIMEQWLLTGEEPKQYRTVVEKERFDLITALESGQIKAEVKDGIAVVESTHRAATLVGYCLAPVVVALNPNFRFQGGDPHRKFTVCQYTKGFVDLAAVADEANTLEPLWEITDPAGYDVGPIGMEQPSRCSKKDAEKLAFSLSEKLGEKVLVQQAGVAWGGSPTIIGSPQGVGSTLTIEQVTEVVSRHLLRGYELPCGHCGHCEYCNYGQS